MLISHKYQFIFIKTTKTAGTSIEVDLSKFMGEQDIITPIYPAVRGHAPRNYAKRSFFGMTTSQKFYSHMPAAAVRRVVGAETFNTYFKFCVEREPVDKCVSHYSMLKNSPTHNSQNQSLTWEEYVERAKFPLDHKKYLDFRGKLMVDTIIKYETLDRQLLEIGRYLGFNMERISTRAKSGFREKVIASEWQRERIYRFFEPSLKATGYSIRAEC